ncbi:uncharacterized protein [Nicotiana sylvestris]|uniref:Uncharacterized protein n=2 Tax=Nicotiana TaxID=4085 RepID=A0A1S4BS15_TOBAC|nr:PREDICTED: uncharacterized protein LOC104237258 [Nicotiana sylvestris]XP_016491588.1 PREDICTED: uncharacterized protein LOC107811216 [Nicotiana tabacum]
MEVEDDLFFANLSKQISLLIMDDDERDPSTHSSSVILQAFPQQMDPTRKAPYIYGQSCKRESKGTGVFIPCSSYPRRNNNYRQGRSISSNTNLPRHAIDPRRVLHTHFNDNPLYDSLNPRNFS